jgi:hypothetical protein
MPATLVDKETYLASSILKVIKQFGPQTPAMLAMYFPGVNKQHIRSALVELSTRSEVIYEVSSSRYLLAPIESTTIDVVAEPIENNAASKQKGSSKQITLTVSPAMYQALRKYARLQETSIEAEAQHLLAETIRMYQHSNVIPT